MPSTDVQQKNEYANTYFWSVFHPQNVDILSNSQVFMEKPIGHRVYDYLNANTPAKQCQSVNLNVNFGIIKVAIFGRSGLIHHDYILILSDLFSEEVGVFLKTCIKYTLFFWEGGAKLFRNVQNFTQCFCQMFYWKPFNLILQKIQPKTRVSKELHHRVHLTQIISGDLKRQLMDNFKKVTMRICVVLRLVTKANK